jgi:chaperonin GroEL (HSP60 family)
LAQAIVKSLKTLRGANPMDLKRGIDKAEAIVADLAKKQK